MTTAGSSGQASTGETLNAGGEERPPRSGGLSRASVLTAGPPKQTSTGRQIGFVVVGDAVTVGALLLTAVALARTISQSDMATYRQVTYLGPLVVSIAELGVSATVYRYLPYFQGRQQQTYLWGVLIAIGILGLGASLTLAALASPLAVAYKNPLLAEALLVAAPYPLAVMPFMLVRPVLISRGYSLKATSLETLFGVGTALAMIAPLRMGWRLGDALGVWILANGCRLPVTAWYMRKELRGSRPAWDSTVAREVWGYSWPLQLSRLPGIAMAYFDQIVSSILLRRESFAAYSLGARELPFLNGIAFSMSAVLVPRMVTAFQEGDTGRICTLWRQASLSTALLTYPVAAFAILRAKDLVRVLFTSSYDESSIPFMAFAAITFLRVVDYGSLAKALGASHVVLLGSILAAVTALPLSVVLTWSWGARGLSFSLLLSTAILIAYYLLRYRVLLGRSIHEFFPLGHLALVGLIAFASALLGNLVGGLALGSTTHVSALALLVRLSTAFLATGVVYVTLVVLLRYTMPSVLAGARFPWTRA